MRSICSNKTVSLIDVVVGVLHFMISANNINNKKNACDVSLGI